MDGFILIPNFSSLVSLEVVIMTTFHAAINNKVDIMITLSFSGYYITLGVTNLIC